jgi:hypothetical protein
MAAAIVGVPETRFLTFMFKVKKDRVVESHSIAATEHCKYPRVIEFFTHPESSTYFKMITTEVTLSDAIKNAASYEVKETIQSFRKSIENSVGKNAPAFVKVQKLIDATPAVTAPYHVEQLVQPPVHVLEPDDFNVYDDELRFEMTSFLEKLRESIARGVRDGNMVSKLFKKKKSKLSIKNDAFINRQISQLVIGLEQTYQEPSEMCMIALGGHNMFYKLSLAARTFLLGVKMICDEHGKMCPYKLC